MTETKIMDLVEEFVGAGNHSRGLRPAVLRLVRKRQDQRRELRRLNNVIKQMRHDLDRSNERNIQLVNQLLTISKQEAA